MSPRPPITYGEGKNGEAMTTPLAIIDLREIVPRNHRERVLRLFDGLRAGAMIEVLAGEEPTDIVRTLAKERRDQFDWQAVERGPVLWRVRILKKEPPEE